MASARAWASPVIIDCEPADSEWTDTEWGSHKTALREGQESHIIHSRDHESVAAPDPEMPQVVPIQSHHRCLHSHYSSPLAQSLMEGRAVGMNVLPGW